MKVDRSAIRRRDDLPSRLFNQSVHCHVIVAEGIETLETLALVDNLGCDAAQGFLMGRPVPSEEFDLGPVGLRTAHSAQAVTGVRRLQRSFVA